MNKHTSCLHVHKSYEYYIFQTKAAAAAEKRLKKLGIPVLPPPKYSGSASSPVEITDDDDMMCTPLPDLDEDEPVATRTRSSPGKDSSYFDIGSTASTSGLKKGPPSKSAVPKKTIKKSKPIPAAVGRPENPKTYPLYGLEGDDSSFGSGNPPAKKKTSGDNRLAQVLEGRSQIMEKFQDTVSKISEASLAAKEEETPDLLFAKSIAHQMKRMSDDMKDRFMLQVHKLAVDAIHGNLED